MKTEHKKLIEQRLERALRSLYHNATPHYPRVPDELADDFNNWFYDAASWELQYIKEGLGRTAKEYLESKKRGWEGNERYYWLVSRITEFGELFTWGRGGRTLAPKKLIRQRGGSSFSINKDYFEEANLETKIEAIEIIEAFNQYVENWNSRENLLEMWKIESKSEQDRVAQEAKVTREEFYTLAKEAKKLGLSAGAVCNVLQTKCKNLYYHHQKLIHQLVLWHNETLRTA